jgi:hypothetical protein
MRLAVLLLVVVAFPSVRAEAVDPIAEERAARTLHEEATRHFHRGNYDQAIVAYKAAYARAAQPALLFNIAQAYRAKHDRQNALSYYEAFLRADPTTAERRFVEARIAELQSGVTQVRLGAEPPPAIDRPAGAGLRTAGAVTAGAGALLAGAGLVFTVQAHGRIDGAVDRGDAGDVKRLQTRAVLFTASGVLAMVAGGVMFYVGPQPVKVAPAVAPGATGLQVSGAF